MILLNVFTIEIKHWFNNPLIRLCVLLKSDRAKEKVMQIIIINILFKFLLVCRSSEDYNSIQFNFEDYT